MLAMYIFLALCCVTMIGVGAHYTIRNSGTVEASGGLILSVMATAFTVYFAVQAIGAYRLSA